MRFFMIACTFCVLIASLGCMTNNWSSPLFPADKVSQESEYDDSNESAEKPKSNFWTSKFGEGSGIDPRAQAIEKRFGL